MAKFEVRISHILWMLLLVGLLAGCEGLEPYRTSDPGVAQTCDPHPDYTVSEECRTNVVEHSQKYDLFFTEFDDQGLQYPAQLYPHAAYQINRTLKGLQQLADSPDVKGISIVVFVHGWNHNASYDDTNVIAFRALLRSTAEFEQARGSGYRVVGVYVGWRGKVLRSDLLEYVSFWDRKGAALRVAQGSPRELFSRLRNFQCKENRATDADQYQKDTLGGCTELASGGAQRRKVRMLMIGHSFGAWILYNAVAGSLIESLTHANDTGDSAGVVARYADMIVLLNPAFEASRYTPLHRVATTLPSPPSAYQAPLLVSITTSADWATRTAFPAGRFINTILENETGEEERIATKYTMGHMTDTAGHAADYVTHELIGTKSSPPECANWKPLRAITDPNERTRQANINKDAEDANTNKFPGTRPGVGLDPGWQRTFCGGAQLTHNKKYFPNSVIWNVHTDDSVMTGHNDIENPTLIEFVRQLYHDTVLYPRTANPDTGPKASPAPKLRAGSSNTANVGGASLQH